MPDWGRRLAKAGAEARAGDALAAIRTLTPLSGDPTAPIEAVRALAGLYRGLGRNAEARPLLERLSNGPGAGAVAAHNLAAALGDMGDAAAALRAADLALARGGDAPETWLVRARALLALSRLDEARMSLEGALVRRPGYVDALKDKANLIWMMTGDAQAAMAVLDGAAAGADPRLALVRSQVARDILGDRPAYDALRPWLSGSSDAAVLLAAATAAAGFDLALGLSHAEDAVRLIPHDPWARKARAGLLIAMGRDAQALPDLEAIAAEQPADQNAWALLQTAWRRLDDPRALSAADYARLVRTYDLTPPPGVDPATWLGKAAEGLRRLHPFRAEPLGQSIRSGVQAALDPRHAGDPSIHAVFQALDAPIQDYIAAMSGEEPMARRRGEGHEIIGAWSVRLTAGGRHSDHIHPNGWISSALYIQTPDVAEDAPRAAWLRFGAASLGAGMEMPAEHWVEPKPGRVVLFPSYLWHGTEPFTGGGERLTIAFDVQPR